MSHSLNNASESAWKPAEGLTLFPLHVMMLFVSLGPWTVFPGAFGVWFQWARLVDWKLQAVMVAAANCTRGSTLSPPRL
eukprot:3911091-Pyramimonas_sp.AAC.1